MLKSTDPMESRAIIYMVDMATLSRFSISRKMREWLHLHPNFIRNGKKYTHLCENEYLTYMERQNGTDRIGLPEPSSTGDSEELTDTGDDV